MKQIMRSTVKQIKRVTLRTAICVQNEACRFATENRGDVNLASMVALVVVVVGAIVAVGAVLQSVAPELVNDLFVKIREWLGL